MMDKYIYLYPTLCDAYAILNPQSFWKNMVTLENASDDFDNICCNL